STTLKEGKKEDSHEQHLEALEDASRVVHLCNRPDDPAADCTSGPGRRVDLRSLEPRQEPQRWGNRPFPLRGGSRFQERRLGRGSLLPREWLPDADRALERHELEHHHQPEPWIG